MKFIKLSFVLLAAFALVLQSSCSKKEDPVVLTTAQTVAMQWKVSSHKVNGQSGSGNEFTNFRITFAASTDGSATTYSITGSTSDQPKPTAKTSGTWALESSDTRAIFDKGTADEMSVTIVSISATQITLKWTEPKSRDKTQPEYEIVLVPAS